MEMIDQKKAQRVWSRVMSCQQSGQTAAAAQDCQCQCACRLSPDQILDLIREEKNACAAYRYLACCLSGCAKQYLQQMAEEERCHARKLGALYFLLTGKKACTCEGKPPCVTCINETLRQLYRKELEDARYYGRLAKTDEEWACTFEELSRQECCHAHKIYCILQNTL